MPAILHIWSDLYLEKIKHGKRSRVLSGAVQRADHFFHYHVRVPTEIWSEHQRKRRSIQGASLRVQLFFITGENLNGVVLLIMKTLA